MRFFLKNSQTLSDEELMVRLIEKDDHEALSELYQRYSSRLLGYFIKMFRGNVPKAQDFLQDLFVKIIERKNQFKTDRKFYTWVFTIASNMCKTDFRYQEDLSLNTIPDQHLWVSGGLQSDERKQMNALLRNAIHTLDHHHKVTFLLRYVEGFSLQEVSEITETNLGTVKSRLFYATQKMAEQLEEYKSDFNVN